MPSFSVQVPADFQGSLRLDKYIASLPGGMNRSKLKSSAIEILVNGKTQKLSAAVKALDIIDVQWDDNVPDDITPENIALSVLYEDENVAVIERELGINVKCHFMPVEYFIKRCRTSFDYIFFDPPFPYKFHAELIKTAVENGMCKSGGTILVHRPEEHAMPDEIGKLFRTDMRSYGRSIVDFYSFR